MTDSKKRCICVTMGFLLLLPAAVFAIGGQEPDVAPDEVEGTLVLYTAANEMIEAALIEGFQEKYPGIEIERVNISSGPITAKIIAEMNNPGADVIWGLYESYQKVLMGKGAIEPYRPQEVDSIDPRFVDPDNFYTGHFVTLMTAGINTEIMEEKGLPIPETWEDLAKPIYRGMINIASPAQSGTGMTIMTALHDMYGGWDYIDKLDENVFQYNDSGGAAGRQAARGEIAIGLTYDVAVLSLKDEGFPVQELFPPNTIYTAECGALIAGAKHPELGKLWLDYLCTTDAMITVGAFVSAVTRTDVIFADDWKPDLSELDLYVLKNTYDLDKFADDWLTRYSR